MAIVPKVQPNQAVMPGRVSFKKPRPVPAVKGDPALVKTVSDLATATETALNKMSQTVANQVAVAQANPTIPNSLTLSTLDVTGSATINDLTLTGTVPAIPGTADAFAYVTCATPAIANGLHATGVTKSSTGVYVVTFSALPTSPVVLTGVQPGGFFPPCTIVYAFSGSNVTVYIYDVSTSALFDPTGFSLAVFG